MAEVGMEVLLVKGATFREPDGTTWRRGGLRLITDEEKLAYYRSNARFVVRLPGAGAAKPDGEKKPRSRSEMRQREVDRQPEPAPVSRIPEKVAPKFSDDAIANAKLVIDDKMKVDHLRRIAKTIGAFGPSGTPPEMAKKKELVGWIRTRQAEILATIQTEPEPVDLRSVPVEDGLDIEPEEEILADLELFDEE